jgi:hypothetical protein
VIDVLEDLLHIVPYFLASIFQTLLHNFTFKIGQRLPSIVKIGGGNQYEVKANLFPHVATLRIQKLVLKVSYEFYMLSLGSKIDIANYALHYLIS